MKLADYLVRHGLSQAEFARTLGVTQGLVWQWLNERQRITGERAIQIEVATRGEVARHDLRPDLYCPPVAEPAA